MDKLVFIMLIDVEALRGELILITGTMNSGKTDEVIKMLSKTFHSSYNKAVMAFANSRNTRDGTKRLVSSSGLRSEEVYVADADNPANIYEAIKLKESKDGEQLVFIFDEGNLHNYRFVPVVKDLMNAKKVVVVAGLNLDFRGEPFGPMGKLEEIARGREAITGKKLVETHHSYCGVLRDDKQCSKTAGYTFRLIKSREGDINYFNEGHLLRGYKKAPYHHPTILVEGSSSGIDYTTACSECFGELPGKKLVEKILISAMNEKECKYEDLVKNFEKFGDVLDAAAYCIEERKLNMTGGIYTAINKSDTLNSEESTGLIKISKIRDQRPDQLTTLAIYQTIKSSTIQNRGKIIENFGKTPGIERILSDLIRENLIKLEYGVLTSTPYFLDPASGMYVPIG